MKKLLFAFGGIIALVAGFIGVLSQTPLLAGDITTLTLISQTELPQDTLTAFYDEYPDVRVQVEVYPGQVPGGAVYSDIPAYLDALREEVNRADVLTVDVNHGLTREATRAGYFLDITPLTEADDEIPLYDANLWQSFQWDERQWGVPLAGNYIGILYQPAMFEAAGQATPDATWTLQDVIHAAEQLHAVTNQPALLTYNNRDKLLQSHLVKSETGIQSDDMDTLFAAPERADFIQTWLDLHEQGVIASLGDTPEEDNAPMIVGLLSFLQVRRSISEQAVEFAPLPGNQFGLHAKGLAISGGTNHPELAYELAVYLSQQPEYVQTLAMDYTTGQRVTDTLQPASNLPDDIEARMESIVSRAIPASAMPAVHYLDLAVFDLLQSPALTVEAALQQARQQADDALQEAVSRRGTVQGPDVQPTLVPGQIELHFAGIASLVDPTSAELTRVVDEFVAADDEVGTVRFVSMDNLTGSAPPTYDCLYSSVNLMYELPASLFTAIGPFVNADTARDTGAIPVFLLPELSSNGELYGYPLTLDPHLIRYDTSNLPDTAASLAGRATFTDFRQLSVSASNGPGFASEMFDTSVMLALMSAADAPVYDYSTIPPTINLTDSNYLDGVQTVLDMAKNGVIAYQALSGGGAPGMNESALFKAEPWSRILMRLARMQQQNLAISDTELAVYPAGSARLPLIMDIGAGYILQQTPHKEACYRWIVHLSQQPQLMNRIPARTDLLEQTTLQSAPPIVMATARQVVERLESVQMQYFPPAWRRFNQRLNLRIEGIWLGQAFDGYVLEDGNLTTLMQTAEDKILAYRECRRGIDPTGEVMEQEAHCVRVVDPDLAEQLELRN